MMSEMIREDGRKYNELRPIKIEAGVLERADGSAYLEVGGNKILVAVYGPRESYIRRLLEPNTGVIRCRYNMAPFSVDDRKRPGPDRRSSEISKITADALRPALMLENYPRSMVDIYIEVIEAEGGTRCAGITAASVALVDAGIPMKDIVVGCAAGKVNDEIVLDLSEVEDKEGQADVPKSFTLSLMNLVSASSVNRALVCWYKNVLFAEPPPLVMKRNSYSMPGLPP